MSGLVPSAFAERVSQYEPQGPDLGASYAVTGADWLRRLPGLLDELATEWRLEPDGPSWSGSCAVAIPVRAPEGAAVLKVGWPHLEALTEHLALRHWAGRGAVRLLRADPHRSALLLERLDPTQDLTTVPVDEACGVLGDLLARLTVPAVARTPTLTAYVERQVGKAAPPGVPRRFVDRARHLAVELSDHPLVDARLLHTDLHYANVLRGRDQEWLAIDPKPMAGDPAFEVAPALWNRADDLGTGSTFRWSVRRRLEIICERAGIDEERARGWTVVREVDNAAQPGLTPDRVSLAVAIVKAMHD